MSWIDELVASSDTLNKRRPEKRASTKLLDKYAVMTDRLAELRLKEAGLAVDAMMALAKGSCTGDSGDWERTQAELKVVHRDIDAIRNRQNYRDLEEEPVWRQNKADRLAALITAVADPKTDKTDKTDKTAKTDKTDKTDKTSADAGEIAALRATDPPVIRIALHTAGATAERKDRFSSRNLARMRPRRARSP